MAHAFRCRNCGRLHEAAHAGVAQHPGSCSVCSAGVKFDEQGNKTLQHDNWEVLADATPARLAELGLETAHVERHVRKSVAQSNAEDHARCVAELAKLDAREAARKANHAALNAEWNKLHDRLGALSDDPESEVERVQLQNAIDAIEVQDFTARDEATRKQLQARIALGAENRPASAGTTFVRARDGAAAVDQGKGKVN